MSLTIFAIIMTLVAAVFCYLWYRKDEEARYWKDEYDRLNEKIDKIYQKIFS